MKFGHCKAMIAGISILLLGAIAHADTYSKFQTTRYYSASRQYVLKITPNKRATLYRNDGRLRKVWSRTLSEIPSRLFLTNDGSRVVMVDNYYGNGGSANTNVLLFLDDSGNEIANYSLGEIADLPRVMQTTSSAHWYYGAYFARDQSKLIVETAVKTCEPEAGSVHTQEELEAYEACMRSHPYEEFQFSTETGKLISRVNIEGKYDDPETRLIHELDVVEGEEPQRDLSVTQALLNLAHFYGEQNEYAKAKDFYERAIPLEVKALGESSAASIIGETATNYRNLGDYVKAEQYYRRALISLDAKQGNPRSVYPVTIRIYEEFAALLRILNRNNEAEGMIKRARVIRAVYPDYK